nr:hypothetical protein [Campylobacter sp.]
MKRKNKILILLFAFCSILFANEVSENIITSSSYGDKTINERELNSKDLNYRHQQTLYKETILNWHYYFTGLNPRAKEVVGSNSKFVFPVTYDKTSGVADGNKSKQLVTIKGFCFITDDVNVGKQPASLRVECQTNGGAVTMFGNLVNVNEKASLVVDPKYIEKDGVRFYVDSSIVTNEAKTSYNVATYVNDRKIAEIGWGGLSVSADEMKTATNEYLRALEQSKTKQEVVYVTTTDPSGNSYMTPTTTTNTQEPDPLDYLVKAGVNIVASVVKNTAEIFKADLPYLYQIVGGSKIWIDLKVNKQGEYVK